MLPPPTNPLTVITHRTRAGYLQRMKDEEIINTQIKLLKDFRPYVKSLLPPDCRKCDKCKAREKLEQERKFREILAKVEVEKQLKASKSPPVLPGIDNRRPFSAGRQRRINRDSRLNPRLVLQRTDSSPIPVAPSDLRQSTIPGLQSSKHVAVQEEELQHSEDEEDYNVSQRENSDFTEFEVRSPVTKVSIAQKEKTSLRREDTIETVSESTNAESEAQKVKDTVEESSPPVVDSLEPIADEDLKANKDGAEDPIAGMQEEETPSGVTKEDPTEQAQISSEQQRISDDKENPDSSCDINNDSNLINSAKSTDNNVTTDDKNSNDLTKSGNDTDHVNDSQCNSEPPGDTALCNVTSDSAEETEAVSSIDGIKQIKSKTSSDVEIGSETEQCPIELDYSNQQDPEPVSGSIAQPLPDELHSVDRAFDDKSSDEITKVSEPEALALDLEAENDLQTTEITGKHLEANVLPKANSTARLEIIGEDQEEEEED